MNDPNLSTVGDLIKAFYEQRKGPRYLDELKIVKGWSTVVGPFIAQYTKDLHLKNGILWVRITSDSLRNELSYSKTVLMRNLNALADHEVVKDIVFQ